VAEKIPDATSLFTLVGRDDPSSRPSFSSAQSQCPTRLIPALPGDLGLVIANTAE